MVFGRLRHAKQAVEFGQQPGERAAVAQHLEHARGLRFHEAAREFLPYPLGHQRIDFTGLDHGLHQRPRLGCHAEFGEARGKAGHPQDAHRVFGKGLAHMAETFCSQVDLPTVGVDNLAGCVLGHGVDGEVAAQQVFFERDVGRGMDDEALVAAPRFALGAGKRVFLMGIGMQEDREVLADRLVALRDHLLGRGTDDDMIAVGLRQPQQAVTHGPADNVGLHAIGTIAPRARGSPRSARAACRRAGIPGRWLRARPAGSRTPPAMRRNRRCRCTSRNSCRASSVWHPA